MAANRQASAAATALVTRLIQADEHLAGQDLLDLRTALAKALSEGVRFGATKPALVNVCSLLPGFTGHLAVGVTKLALVDAMIKFIDAEPEQLQQPQQPGPQPQQQPQLPQQQPQLPGPEVGSVAWRTALIRDLVAAQNTVAVAPAVVQEPALLSDTDSDTQGFHSHYVDWLEMTFVGSEEDLVPLLEAELERLGTAAFLLAFGQDAEAMASCRRELPAMLGRPDRSVPAEWSVKKLVKLWTRALNRAILSMKPLILKRARARKRQRPEGARVPAVAAVAEPKHKIRSCRSTVNLNNSTKNIGMASSHMF